MPRAPIDTHYARATELLPYPPGATDAPEHVIRSNYRTLLQKLRVHPDLGGTDRDAATVNTAYQTLRDPTKRAAYDRELLARYSVQVLGQGGVEYHGTASPRGRDGENRRNHYRVLQVQRDASPAIIEASYRALTPQAQGAALEQIEAAYAVLSDPTSRRAYDEAPAVVEDEESPRELVVADAWEHAVAEERLPAVTASSAHYSPLIVRYCAFCKTPHGGSLAIPSEDRRCVVCDSPPRCPARRRRARQRARCGSPRWDSQVMLRLEWPGPRCLRRCATSPRTVPWWSA